MPKALSRTDSSSRPCAFFGHVCCGSVLPSRTNATVGRFASSRTCTGKPVSTSTAFSNSRVTSRGSNCCTFHADSAPAPPSTRPLNPAKKPRTLDKGTAASLDAWNSRATTRAAMPRILGSIGNHPFGTGDGYESRPVHTWSAFYYPRGPTGAGALLFNSGQYNRSVLISAIRVARAGSRLWGYRPNRTSDLGNFKPAILRNFKPPLTPSESVPNSAHLAQAARGISRLPCPGHS